MDFQTGDLLLFHHTPDYSSLRKGFMTICMKVIAWWTGSKYDHAALIVKDPLFTNPEFMRDGLFVLESSCDDHLKDVEDHKYKVGDELESFEKVLEKWSGQVYWRSVDCVRDVEFYRRLDKAHTVVHGKPYDFKPADWFRAEFLLRKKKMDRSTKAFFCSALVSYVYTELRLLPEDTDWGIVSPDQLGTELNMERPKVIFQRCMVADEVLIKKE